ncbi:MAG: SemiSWEET family transporter [Candidatus Falkowbacteria bacterium]
MPQTIDNFAFLCYKYSHNCSIYHHEAGLIKFTEIQSFGFNTLTVIFFITILFTVLQGYALYKQNKKVLKTKSGKSVSFIFFAYFGFSALAVSIYGLYKCSLALAINGLLGFLSLAIVFNLLRFKPLGTREKILGLGSVIVIVLVIIIPQKDILFLFFGLVISATLLMQILEVWNNKSSGSVDPKQAFFSIFSSTFWLIYAIITSNLAFTIVSAVAVLMWAAMIILYLVFKDKPEMQKT